MNKKDIFLYVLVSLLLFAVDSSVRFLEPTGHSAVEVSRRTPVIGIDLIVNLAETDEYEKIRLETVSPLGNANSYSLTEKRGDVLHWRIEDEYVSGLVLSYPKGYDKQINSIEVKKNGISYAIDAGVRSPEADDVKIVINGEDIGAEKSPVPFLLDIINYKGNLFLVLPGFLLGFLFFVIISGVTVFIRKSFLPSEQSLFYSTALFFVLMIISDFLLTWKVCPNGYAQNSYWFYAVKTGLFLITAILILRFYRQPARAMPEIQSGPELKENQYKVMLGIVLLIAFLLRVINIGRLSMTTDEIYVGISVKQILSLGVPIMPDGFLYNRGWINSYLGAFFSLIPGLSFDAAVRLPGVLAGLAIVGMSAKIVKRYTTPSLAIAAAVFISIFPWAIEFSRWGRMYGMVALFILCTVYMGMLFISSGKKVHFAGIILFSALAIITDKWGYFCIVILGLAVLYRLFNTRVDFRGFFRNRRYVMTTSVIILSLGLAYLIVPQVRQYLSRLFSYLTAIDFSPYFLHFFIYYFGIFIIAALFLIKWSCSAAKSNRLEYNFIAVVSILSLLFVSFFHLHNEPRYLYFVAVLFIPMVFIGLFVFLTESSGAAIFRRGLFYSLAVFLGLAIAYVNVYYAFSIPFRAHGDEYYVEHYAPTTVSNYIADRRSNVRFAQEVLEDGDILIANSFQFMYYYAGMEPDYLLRPGRDSYFSDADDTVRYMSRTKLIAAKEELIDELQKDDFTKRLVMVLNLRGGHEEESNAISEWIYRDLSKYYTLEKAFAGAEPYSQVIIADPR